MPDVILMSGISGLSFLSPFLSPLSFFSLVLSLFLSGHVSANGPFSLSPPPAPQPPFRKFSNFFGKRLALVEQRRDDSWLVINYVQPAAKWHWYLSLCDIMIL